MSYSGYGLMDSMALDAGSPAPSSDIPQTQTDNTIVSPMAGDYYVWAPNDSSDPVSYESMPVDGVAPSAGFVMSEQPAVTETSSSGFAVSFVNPPPLSPPPPPACFCRGTMILTKRGEVRVEDLVIGDQVLTLSGSMRSVHWIGRRAYNGRFVSGNPQVLPVRVTTGALADGVPARDLYVSPEHSLYLKGALVQAMFLVNGATITQEMSVDQLEYFHIELDTHDVIFADGAPAETFIDCDNRRMFENGAEYKQLYPDDCRPRWAFCLPRLEQNSVELVEIRAELLMRVAALGHLCDDDPELHLLVNGEIARSETLPDGCYRFSVPAGCTELQLVSRYTVPGEVEAASCDMRRLGVAVERLLFHDDSTAVEVRCDHYALRDGFHESEATHRWTNGRARLPKALWLPFAGGFTLELWITPNSVAYRTPLTHRAA